jgi:hypothetical protein
MLLERGTIVSRLLTIGEIFPTDRYSPGRYEGEMIVRFAPNFQRNFALLTFFSLLLAACANFPSIGSRPEMPFFGSGGSGEENVSNGERIYFLATNDRGERNSYTGGPNFGGMMMGSYLTCAACHGPEARGGVHAMHMQIMDAPDIRYSTLSGETGEHEEGEDGHTQETSEYDLEDFRMAVVERKHPDGEYLSQDMPRWQINDQDLADLFTFLKSLPE